MSDLARDLSGSPGQATRNEALVRRIFDDVINGRELGAADEICSDETILHVPGLELPTGPDGLRAFARSLLEGFPDLEVAIDDVLATDDGAAVRWHTVRQTHTGPYRGIPPTGRSVTMTGINVYRLEDGRCLEAWVQADSVGLAQQLGVVPPDGLEKLGRARFVVGSFFRMAYLEARHSLKPRPRP